MKSLNYLDLDANLLRTFLIILEESSVSTAAQRLDLTQSAVSHSLARLRKILGDPLFVRSGQGLKPTEVALSLKVPMQKVLDDIKALTDRRDFDPRLEPMRFVVAAMDLPRELLFPELMRQVRTEQIQLFLKFIPSGMPDASILRDDRCQLMITPTPPESPSLYQRRMYSGTMMCFYDADARQAPQSLEEYYEAEHIDVQFADGRSTAEILSEMDLSRMRPPTVTVSNFNSIPSLIKGSPMIATQVDLMQLGPLQSLAVAPLPFETSVLNFYMLWHERSQNDPAHIWFRNRLFEIAQKVPYRMAGMKSG